MTFHIGQKVKCIRDDWETRSIPFDLKRFVINFPKAGVTYHVRTVAVDREGMWLRLEEVVNPSASPLRQEVDWAAHCFRPLTENDLPESLTALLDNKNHTPLPEDEPERRKVRKPERVSATVIILPVVRIKRHPDDLPNPYTPRRKTLREMSSSICGND